MKVPPWLEPMLNTQFFTMCRIHADVNRSECNMYCLDCNGGAFCSYCRSSRHKNHQVIQIRRASYHDVVRVTDIQNVLDIRGVQPIVINSAHVLFLNRTPNHPKSGKLVACICEICARNLFFPYRFCSLGCKLEGVKKNGNASCAMDGKNKTLTMDITTEGMSKMSILSTQQEEPCEGSSQNKYPATPPPRASKARRRKGIPHRAPLM